MCHVSVAFQHFVNVTARIWPHDNRSVSDDDGFVEYQEYDPVIRDVHQYDQSSEFKVRDLKLRCRCWWKYKLKLYVRVGWGECKVAMTIALCATTALWNIKSSTL